MKVQEGILACVLPVCIALSTWAWNLQGDISSLRAQVSGLKYSKANTKEVYSQLGVIQEQNATLAEAIRQQTKILEKMDQNMGSRLDKLEDRFYGGKT